MTPNVEDNNAPGAQTDEMWRLHRLLREIAQLAQHASLTGSLEKGAPSAIRRYNFILQRLEQTGSMAGHLFEPLPESASFDELGVDATLLAGYIAEDSGESNGRDRKDKRRDRGGDDLRDLAQMVRENLPQWLREINPEPPVPPTPPTSPTPPALNPPQHPGF